MTRATPEKEATSTVKLISADGKADDQHVYLRNGMPQKAHRQCDERHRGH